MKYIIFKRFNEEFPVLFPSTIKHSDMAHTVAGTPISAGFIKPSVYNQGLACYGDSMTLKLPSRPVTDSFLINQFLGLEGTT